MIDLNNLIPQSAEWHRIKSDINGNSRHVIHFLSIDKDFNKALKIANKLGGRKYHNKSYGGGIVFHVTRGELEELSQRLNELIEQTN